MRTEEQESAPGRKGIITVVVFLLLTAGAIALQIRYRGFAGPLSDNILIFILILANILLLAAVMFLIGRNLWKLSVERRSKVLGAKFRTRLVAAFVSLSLIPTVLLFVIGSGMYTRGIERLFSLRIESALQDSVSVTESYYDRMKGQARSFGRQIGQQVADQQASLHGDARALKEFLGRKAAEYGVGAVELYGADRSVAARVVTSQFPAKTFSATPADLVARAFAAEGVAAVTDLGRRGEIVRAVVPLAADGAGSGVSGALAVSYYVPSSLTRKIDDIRSGYAEYRSSFQNKDILKMSYRLGFLAVMLTLLLAAIWVALRVATDITVPIRKLAEGTMEVARGNLDHRIKDRSGDEVGLLVESFNKMTADLQHSSERLRQEVTNREVILNNIDAGVISLDRSGRITTVNPAASRILGIQADDVLHRRYDEAFGYIDLGPVRSMFRKLEEGHGSAEEELSLVVRGRTLTLRLRVSTIRDDAGALHGSVITFDDITELLRAKKAETWQDVARKIAHEVKNPLTPIKLSAERLRKKYLERSPDFDRVFDESSQVIVREVDGLKGLLDEFSEFARLPRPNPSLRRLEPVIDSAIQLYAATHKGIRFVKDVPADLPEIPLDQDQMKRVFINLFKNAIEVMEQDGEIRVSARAADGMVRVEVADNGPGISREDVARLFEPYFSRKQKGGGLGLAIVERIIADHNGSVHAEPGEPCGARFVMELPVKPAAQA